MLTAEMNNESLRPRVSTTKKTKIAVATVLTTPATTTVQWEGGLEKGTAVRTVDATREKRVLGTVITNLMTLLRVVRAGTRGSLLADVKI